MDELLTTRQVASELRVSESSVKRWCDMGLIPMQRTAGGHRRIGRSSLDQFVITHYRTLTRTKADSNQQVIETADTYQTSTSTREDIARQFQQDLLAGNEGNCRALMERWYQRSPNVAQLGDLLIAGAMETIGKLWECGRAEVYEERRSCEICMHLLADLKLRVPNVPSSAPRAIGGTISGDHYTLANSLVELVLRESGWNATSLGGDLPFETLLKAVQRERPRLLWLSVSHVEDSENFVAEYNQFYSQLPADLTVAVGGRALTDELRPRIGFTAHCDNLEQLTKLAKVIGRIQ